MHHGQESSRNNTQSPIGEALEENFIFIGALCPKHTCYGHMYLSYHDHVMINLSFVTATRMDVGVF